MTRPQDKMRAEFEAAMRADPHCWVNRDFHKSKTDGQTYANFCVEVAWKTWQAACAQQSAQSQQDAITPLTDEQIKSASLKAGMQEHYMGFHSGFIKFARAIEAGHGITAIATQGASNV